MQLTDVVGVIVIIMGLVRIFAPDLVWELTMWSNETEGKASGERTETWEVWRVIMGVVHIIFGLIVLAAQ